MYLFVFLTEVCAAFLCRLKRIVCGDDFSAVTRYKKIDMPSCVFGSARIRIICGSRILTTDSDTHQSHKADPDIFVKNQEL
jgi:hypothetical protein